MGARFTLVCAFFLLAGLLAAARVEGTVYDLPALNPANAVVEVNSTPNQVVAATNGTYSFDLPVPGSYTLAARAYRQMGGRLVLYGEAEENITLRSEGVFRVDLVLLPPLEEVPSLVFPDLPSGNLSEVQQASERLAQPASSPLPLVAAILLLVALLITGYWYLRKNGWPPRRPPRAEGAGPSSPGAPSVAPRVPLSVSPVSAPAPPKGLGDDAKRVIEALAAKGGRLGQKELRKSLGWSQAKASLLITELEDLGIVRRLRKGRGNVVRLEENGSSERPAERTDN